MARPFAEKSTSISSLSSDGDALQQGESYYNLARRRLGLLDTGILAPQCHFLAGVYLMYTLRPLRAWSEFQSASRSYFLYLHCQARRKPTVAGYPQASKRRRLEQRLYWSCYKTECELRSEVDLPNSSLADLHYPDMHPSPPDMPNEDAPSPSFINGSTSGRRSVQGPGGSIVSQPKQEQIWYYYLTEITLRRIANRVLNTLYSTDLTSWTDDVIPFMVKAAEEFELQLKEWYDFCRHSLETN